VCARRSCQNEDGSDDPNKGTQLVEVYAMEIQARRRAADIHTRNTARPFRSTHSDVCGCSIKGQGSMHCRRCSERADKQRPSVCYRPVRWPCAAKQRRTKHGLTSELALERRAGLQQHVCTTEPYPLRGCAQMHTELKNSKRLKDLYHKALTIKSAIPHPRILGVIRECGGKMYMHERSWSEAATDFFEARAHRPARAVLGLG